MKKLLKKFHRSFGISIFKEIKSSILNIRYRFLTIWKDIDWDDYLSSTELGRSLLKSKNKTEL